MNGYFQILILAVSCLLVGVTTWHVKDKFDVAAQEAILQAQVTQHQKKEQDIARTITGPYEAQLAALRQKNAQLNQERITAHAKNTHDCPLPAESLRLLAGSIAPASNSAR
jgi:phage-related minor tail protein